MKNIQYILISTKGYFACREARRQKTQTAYLSSHYCQNPSFLFLHLYEISSYGSMYHVKSCCAAARCYKGSVDGGKQAQKLSRRMEVQLRDQTVRDTLLLLSGGLASQ